MGGDSGRGFILFSYDSPKLVSVQHDFLNFSNWVKRIDFLKIFQTELSISIPVYPHRNWMMEIIKARTENNTEEIQI